MIDDDNKYEDGGIGEDNCEVVDDTDAAAANLLDVIFDRVFELRISNCSSLFWNDGLSNEKDGKVIAEKAADETRSSGGCDGCDGPDGYCGNNFDIDDDLRNSGCGRCSSTSGPNLCE